MLKFKSKSVKRVLSVFIVLSLVFAIFVSPVSKVTVQAAGSVPGGFPHIYGFMMDPTNKWSVDFASKFDMYYADPTHPEAIERMRDKNPNIKTCLYIDIGGIPDNLPGFNESWAMHKPGSEPPAQRRLYSWFTQIWANPGDLNDPNAYCNYRANYIYNHYLNKTDSKGRKLFDAVFLDMFSYGTDPSQFNNIDINMDGFAEDPSIIMEAFNAGMTKILSTLRNLAGNDLMIQTLSYGITDYPNCPYWQYTGGLSQECAFTDYGYDANGNFVQYGRGTGFMSADWPQIWDTYNSMQRLVKPNVPKFYFMNCEDVPPDAKSSDVEKITQNTILNDLAQMQRIRMGMGVVSLADYGYYMDDRDHCEQYWFPEDNADLGLPVSRQGYGSDPNNCYLMDFQNGAILLNAKTDPKDTTSTTFDLGKEYFDVSSRQIVGPAVSVKSNDARILSSDVPFVSAVDSGTRSDYTGYRGMKITTGSSSITVKKLGRYFTPGNKGTHTLKIIKESDKSVVGTAVVSMEINWGIFGSNAHTPDGNGFMYADLQVPVKLDPNTSYYLVSHESANPNDPEKADTWFGSESNMPFLTTTGAANINCAVYGDGTAANWTLVNNSGECYGPLNLVYDVSLGNDTLATFENKSNGVLSGNYPTTDPNIQINWGTSKWMVADGDTNNRLAGKVIKPNSSNTSWSTTITLPVGKVLKGVRIGKCLDNTRITLHSAENANDVVLKVPDMDTDSTGFFDVHDIYTGWSKPSSIVTISIDKSDPNNPNSNPANTVTFDNFLYGDPGVAAVFDDKNIGDLIQNTYPSDPNVPGLGFQWGTSSWKVGDGTNYDLNGKAAFPNSTSTSWSTTITLPAGKVLTSVDIGKALNSGQNATVTLHSSGNPDVTYQLSHTIGDTVYTHWNIPSTSVTISVLGNIPSNSITFDNFVYQDVPQSSLVTDVKPGTRYDNLGYKVYYGMQVTPNTNLKLTYLGRYFTPGNCGKHLLQVFDKATGNLLGSTTINMFLESSKADSYGVITDKGSPADAAGFKYAKLDNPVYLEAGKSYYIVSAENCDPNDPDTKGDQWYGTNGNEPLLTTTITGVASIDKSIYTYGNYRNPNDWYSNDPNSTNRCMGPVTFKYDPSGTTVDDDNASVNYTGAWTDDNACTPAYMQTRHFTATIGAKVEYTFNGTSVRWIGEKDSNRGYADIYIDNVYDATVDTYNASTQYRQVLYTKTGLPSGNHTIRVVCKGTKNTASSGYYITSDAFVVDPLISIPTTVDDDNASVSYTGAWTDDNACIPAYMQTRHFTAATGAKVEYTFNGTSVRWIGEKDSNRGYADIYIDNVYDTTVDTYNASTQFQQVMYTKTGLSSGNHTIRIVCKGTKNTASSGYYITCDAFGYGN